MNNVTPPSPFTTNPEKYTPSSYHGVGRACVTAMLGRYDVWCMGFCMWDRAIVYNVMCLSLY
ncbi:hypothetical protein EON63_09570 [archaeon]|nr:MAG: hypothetical protein EON63_09570 [archaeon]